MTSHFLTVATEKKRHYFYIRLMDLDGIFNYYSQKNRVKNNVINQLLDQQTKYHGKSLKPRLYREIVEGRYDIGEIVRIERKNDKAYNFRHRRSISPLEQLLTLLQRVIMIRIISKIGDEKYQRISYVVP